MRLWYRLSGDAMKKTMKTIFCAFLVGVGLSFITVCELKGKLSYFENKNVVTAFQIGVYKSKENARKMQEQHPGSISVLDGEYYRVFIGVAKDKACEELLERYYFDKKLTVYPKEIEVTSQFFQEINRYEEQISKDDVELFEKMNLEIMKKLEGEIL